MQFIGVLAGGSPAAASHRRASSPRHDRSDREREQPPSSASSSAWRSRGPREPRRQAAPLRWDDQRRGGCVEMGVPPAGGFAMLDSRDMSNRPRHSQRSARPPISSAWLLAGEPAGVRRPAPSLPRSCAILSGPLSPGRRFGIRYLLLLALWTRSRTGRPSAAGATSTRRARWRPTSAPRPGCGRFHGLTGNAPPPPLVAKGEVAKGQQPMGYHHVGKLGPILLTAANL